MNRDQAPNPQDRRIVGVCIAVGAVLGAVIGAAIGTVSGDVGSALGVGISVGVSVALAAGGLLSMLTHRETPTRVESRSWTNEDDDYHPVELPKRAQEPSTPGRSHTEAA